jgi:hypothetical protein
MTEDRPYIFGLATAFLVAALLLVIETAKYEALRTELGTACGGVIASLDLTEWVTLCRT